MPVDKSTPTINLLSLLNKLGIKSAKQYVTGYSLTQLFKEVYGDRLKDLI